MKYTYFRQNRGFQIHNRHTKWKYFALPRTSLRQAKGETPVISGFALVHPANRGSSVCAKRRCKIKREQIPAHSRKSDHRRICDRLSHLQWQMAWKGAWPPGFRYCVRKETIQRNGFPFQLLAARQRCSIRDVQSICSHCAWKRRETRTGLDTRIVRLSKFRATSGRTLRYSYVPVVSTFDAISVR